MSIADALFSEQTSTSLYEKVGDDEKRYVSSLARSKAEYCKLGGGLGTAEDSNTNPEIVVQIRKRKGKLEVLLDGYLSEGTPEKRGGAEVLVHNLEWHQGLHEDVQSDTRVFSPLAIVAAVEDGQRLLQNVNVSLWTTFENQGAPVFQPLLVTETLIVPHRATDARCNTVRAPYPLAYPPPPSLAIFNRAQINRQNAKETVDLAAKGLSKAAITAYKTYMKQIEKQGNAAAPEGSQAISAWLLSWGGKADGSYIDLEQTNATSIAGMVALMQVSLTLVAAAFRHGNYDILSALVVGTIPYASSLKEALFVPNSLTPVGAMSLAFGVGTNWLRQYMKIKPDKFEGQTKFTIKELARTVWSLSAMRGKVGTHTQASEFRRMKSEQYRRELIVWEWLRDVKNDISPVDTSLLEVSSMFATRLTLRVAIDDALGCDPSEAYHEITCGRDDCYALGALAAGNMRDIESLFQAIAAFEKTLEDGINSKTTDTWWDWTFKIAEDGIAASISAFEQVKKTYEKLNAAKQADLYLQKGQLDGFDAAREVWRKKSTKETDEKAEQEWKVQYADAMKELENLVAQANKKGAELDKKFKNAIAKLQSMHTKGMWLKIMRGAKSAGIRYLEGASSPMSEERKNVLKDVKSGLHDKLYPLFFEPGQAGTMLYDKLGKVAQDKRAPTPKDFPCNYIRKLPHRATSENTRRLFLFRADSANGHVDLSTAYAASRVYSEYHDANLSMAAAMDGSAMAMQRLVGEWEANASTRVKLVCMCHYVDTAETGARPYKERVAFGTLVLTTPIDVQAAGAIVELAEYERRQIQLVVRRAQQKRDKSVMERLGLEDNDTSLLVSHVFGDLWSDELVALHKIGTYKAVMQMQMLEPASRRAAARLRAAGKLLLELLTVHNPASGVFVDVPCNATDVSLLATQRGRDAGVIIERLLFNKNYISIRAAFAPLIRRTALAAAKCADAFERSVPEHLPYEPVASLFGTPSDGVAAYERVKSMSDLSDVVSAAVAAYPAVLLLGSDDATHQAAVEAAQRRGFPRAPTAPALSFEELVSAMRYRLASLKMDSLPIDEASDFNIDELTRALSNTSLKDEHHSFYVPFGFGDARPPPTFPPLSAPMFGTVPVFGEHLVSAFAALHTRSNTGTHPCRVVLIPTLGCLPSLSDTEGSSVHPNVIQVQWVDNNEVVVRYTASRVWGTKLSRGRKKDDNAFYAAKEHLQGVVAAGLASDVCAIAWNAERVMQAVVAALGSAHKCNGTDGYDCLELSLVLPHDGGEQSVWFTRPNNPMAMAQKRMYAERKVLFARLVFHYRDMHHQRIANELWEALLEKASKDALKDFSAPGSENPFLDANLASSNVEIGALWKNAKARQGLLEQLKGKFIDIAEKVAAGTKGTFNSTAFDNEYDSPTEAAKAAAAAAAAAATATHIVETFTAIYEKVKAAYGAVEEAHDEWDKETKLLNSVPGRGALSKEQEQRQSNGIVCALGVGMGMLLPLLGTGVALRVGAIKQNSLDGWSDTDGCVKKLQDAFGTTVAAKATTIEDMLRVDEVVRDLKVQVPLPRALPPSPSSPLPMVSRPETPVQKDESVPMPRDSSLYTAKEEVAMGAAVKLFKLRNPNGPPGSASEKILEMLVAHTAFQQGMGVVSENLVHSVVLAVNKLRMDPEYLPKLTPEKRNTLLDQAIVYRPGWERDDIVAPLPGAMTGVDYEDRKYGLYASNHPRMPFLDADNQLKASFWGHVDGVNMHPQGASDPITTIQNEEMRHYARFFYQTVTPRFMGAAAIMAGSVVFGWGVSAATRAALKVASACLGEEVGPYIVGPAERVLRYSEARVMAMRLLGTPNPTDDAILYQLDKMSIDMGLFWYGAAQRKLADEVTNSSNRWHFRLYLHVMSHKAVIVGATSGVVFLHFFLTERKYYTTHRMENFISFNNRRDAEHWIRDLKRRIRLLTRRRPIPINHAQTRALYHMVQYERRGLNARYLLLDIAAKTQSISEFIARMQQYEYFYTQYAAQLGVQPVAMLYDPNNPPDDKPGGGWHDEEAANNKRRDAFRAAEADDDEDDDEDDDDEDDGGGEDDDDEDDGGGEDDDDEDDGGGGGDVLALQDNGAGVGGGAMPASAAEPRVYLATLVDANPTAAKTAAVKAAKTAAAAAAAAKAVKTARVRKEIQANIDKYARRSRRTSSMPVGASVVDQVFAQLKL